MIPFKSLIQLDRSLKQPLFLQMANQIIALIKAKTLAKDVALPGSRKMAELLGVHRKTVVACYEELIMQGWLTTIPKRGTFVNNDIPLSTYQKITEDSNQVHDSAGFTFKDNLPKRSLSTMKLSINDGISDSRLAPVKEIAKIYRNLADKKSIATALSYGDPLGNLELRKTLVQYLNETRGLKISIDNILLTRGSQMGIYLASQLLLNEDTYIIVGSTNYPSADITFKHHKTTILRVSVDENGLCTDEVEELCKRYPIKMIYVTSHHHHPTTVTLSAKRRIHLLNLAQQYQFAILEDDYDYDFHYNHAPILPLASHDVANNVIYIGSVCKTVAPVYRVGYLIAAKDVVAACAEQRRYMDRQGDALLELTFSRFIKEGSLDRHINKVLKIYKERRDHFCKRLQEELSDYIQFEIPKGGMAIWAQLRKDYTWGQVSEVAKNHQLNIDDYQRYDYVKTGHNCIRIGFASYTIAEIDELINVFKKVFNELKQ